MPRIIVLGSINMDLVVTAERFPGPGETIAGEAFRTFSGGKGANQAIAAARMGAKVAFVGAVGADAFGADLVAGMAVEGIDTTSVATVAGVSTGTALITVAQGENCIVVVAGANAAVDGTAAAGLVGSGDRLVAQLEVPKAAIAEAFAAARAAGAETLLNAAPAAPAVRDLLPLTDILIVNETELDLIAGWIGADGGDARTCARSLLAAGPSTVVVTLGAAGLVAVTAEATIELGGHRVVPVDTTGAGDCFVGTLAAGLSAGADLAEALETANAAAALSVQKPGAAPSMPRAEDVRAFLAGRATAGAVETT
ncbi:ribokinase [Prosthecodimorpha staleyi]|uniref:Ribokinase n=1 Tax=Prosthecodimorpha staleyi TaxID=2840188 RepID=A0A947D7R7_9HYPH|nr:ribokinase [Prosthecodimorpha staleyi]MBT9289627.1 ribokinase [Prosthecodimorpha staleyi]